MPSSSAEFNPLPSPLPPQLRTTTKKGLPQKGLIPFKMKNSSSILNMQEVGGGESLPVGYIYMFLQNLLLQTGSFWRTEETWQ